MLDNIKKSFVQNGKLNGKMLSAVIALLIVIVQEVLAICGIQPKGNIDDIVNLINTVLTLLGAIGVVNEVTNVKVSHTNEYTINRTEQLAKRVANAQEQAMKAHAKAQVALNKLGVK